MGPMRGVKYEVLMKPSVSTNGEQAAPCTLLTCKSHTLLGIYVWKLTLILFCRHTQVCSNFKALLGSHEDLIKIQILIQQTEVSLRSCISNQLPRDADTAGPRATFWRARHWASQIWHTNSSPHCLFDSFMHSLIHSSNNYFSFFNKYIFKYWLLLRNLLTAKNTPMNNITFFRAHNLFGRHKGIVFGGWTGFHLLCPSIIYF